jgi:hypothetical protein
MAAVGEKLLTALESRLGLSRSQVNRRIAEEAAANHLPRRLAAISLAAQHRLPTHRFATNEGACRIAWGTLLSHHRTHFHPARG